MTLAGVDEAVFVGLSMGGMIVQELALLYPSMVRGAVLLGTRPPAPANVAPGRAMTKAVMSPVARDEHVRESLRDRWLSFSGDDFASRPEDVDELADALVAGVTPLSAVVAQVRAVTGWHGPGRLSRISSPVTVVHGAVDPLIPVENGRRLAALIPDARYIELPDVGHLVPFEVPDRVADIVESVTKSSRSIR